MIRVLLADDHTILRDGIRALLAREPDIEVVGEAGHGQGVLDLLTQTPADVLLMDLNMPVLDGFATMPLLQKQYPGVQVVILSMLDNEEYVHRAMQAGALGYVLKSAESTEIVFAIRTVATGQSFLCTEVGISTLNRLLSCPTAAYSAVEVPRNNDLSSREMEVLRLIAEGLTNAEIADKLFTSKRTIETHRQNIIEKTQAKNTAALVRYAMSQGLIK
ncbi:response regulator transcription factor [Hymenobacter taeanensis]|uniref:Response regulator transcription factor n=1 Tax=Hymenobacter taeanensis TaxID=2735321 RepID=A0A6M6BF37_9BACT|nr:MULTISPECIES: response regulator transcription factor [Hymenobacter]QJX46354.1 response regulator transcription factor [Hymenobacter taeanensis]UOQ80215.1 response regulator transcription factor [Hymenobacter sp. 5414T-23]